ncbi:LysR substrate-binding domain-containing protein [Pseudomonas sp.]|uniref:LysR substrate-binding domain-containing protein n=1 Tax=Pseudomonas sp. TaxID=306 RepID=UPI000F017014|nr:HTH-type transcriptional activator CmpR [Pseudomonas fluorescens]
MRYELTDLRLFLAIADSESLSIGASVRFLSAPSASYRLKNLEQALGTPLFVRSAKGMVLTPAGRVLLDHVRVLLSAVQHMEGDLSRFSNGTKGHIRIVANSSCIVGLTATLGGYLVTHPNINIELEERLSEDVVQAVTENAVDIGLLAGDVEIGNLDAMLYGEDELILITSILHPLAKTSQVSFATVLDSDFVGLDRKSSNFLFLSQFASKLGRRINARVNVQSFPVLLQLVEDNVGVSIVPRSVANRALTEHRIAGISLQEPWSLRHQRIVANDFASLPPYVRSFVEYLMTPVFNHGAHET